MKPDATTVFYFPIKAPEGSVTRNEMTAIEQLELWKVYQLHWCEHKPSVTISVREKEWPAVGAWVYDNFDLISGVSFLPHSDHTYRQAPYDECDEKKYLEFVEKMPKSINWTDLSFYEAEDTTTGMQTLACSADGCEVVDIG
jgi:ribonucleoside-diphosphate reductase alpha chain